MKNWYKSWFNTHYYHLLYRDRDENEAKRFIENLVTYLKIPAGSLILDLACGKGRHSVQLNELGFIVTGLDLSEKSILSLKQKESETLTFVIGDMRKPYRTGHFDHVFNLFTSFGYFHDDHENNEVIESISKTLKKGGIAVIDYLNAHTTRTDIPSSEKKRIEGLEFAIEKFELNNSVVKKIDFLDEGELKSYSESVKLYDLKDFERFAKNAGMKVISIFGDYDLNEFELISSQRLIMILQKN